MSQDKWDPSSLRELEPHKILSLFRPRYSYFPMRRFGGDGDGAYVLPAIDESGIGPIGSVFSAGVGNRKEFEDELLSLYGARSYLLDRSSSDSTLRTPLAPGQILERKWLSASSGIDSLSLEDWVAEHTVGTERDLLLSIDIEGAEWEALSLAPASLMDRFALIVIELHGLRDFGNPDLYRKKIRPMLRALFYHHSSVHISPNNCCGAVMLPSLGLALPKTLELTLVHKRLLPQEPFASQAPSFPHDLDIHQNQKAKPPLFLVGSFWNQSTSDESRTRRRALLAEVNSRGAKWDARRVIDDLGDLFSWARFGEQLRRFAMFELRAARPVQLDMLGLEFHDTSVLGRNRRTMFVLYLDRQRWLPKIRLARLKSHVSRFGVPRHYAEIRPTQLTRILVVVVGRVPVSIQGIEAFGR